MVLYVFILTPVWLWHRHDYSYNSKSLAGSEVKTELFAGDSKTYFEEICGICSHKFSAYCNNLSFCFDIPFLLQIDKISFYNPGIAIPPYSYLPNKGPPAVS